MITPTIPIDGLGVQVRELSRALFNYTLVDMACWSFDSPAAVPPGPVSLREYDVQLQHGGNPCNGHDTATATLSRPWLEEFPTHETSRHH